MSTKAFRSDYIRQMRESATDLIIAMEELAKLRKQWDWLMSTEIVDVEVIEAPNESTVYIYNDFEDHQGIEKDDLVGVWTTLGSFETLLTAGHGTNLQKVRTR